MPVGRYYIVDTPNNRILSGPIRLDSADVATWPVPAGSKVVTEAAMQAGGYTWPAAAPDPAEALRAKIPQALAANTTFLALASPTNAQTLAQVQRLTRQVNVLGRLAAQLLDSTDDT